MLNFEGIYVLQTREFVSTNEDIYKIGRSNNIGKRLYQYPNESKVFLIINTSNTKKIEADLIKIFTSKFINVRKIGSEYFKGNITEMIKTIKMYISENNIETNIIEEEFIIDRYTSEGEYICPSNRNINVINTIFSKKDEQIAHNNIELNNVNIKAIKNNTKEDNEEGKEEDKSINCNKCGKHFKYVSYLERHIKGKRDCSMDNIKDDGLYCNRCSRHYYNKYSLARHLEKCKSQTADIEINNQEIVAAADNMAFNQVNNDDNKLAIIDENIRSSLVNLKAELIKDMDNYNMDEITKLLKELAHKLNNFKFPLMRDVVINQRQNNIIDDIVIYPFGYETIDHLSTEKKIDILKSPNTLEQVFINVYSYDKNKNFIKYNISRDYVSFHSHDDISTSIMFNDFWKNIMPKNCMSILLRIYFENYHYLNIHDNLTALINIKSEENKIDEGYYATTTHNIECEIVNCLRDKLARKKYIKFIDELSSNSELVEKNKLIINKINEEHKKKEYLYYIKRGFRYKDTGEICHKLFFNYDKVIVE